MMIALVAVVTIAATGAGAAPASTIAQPVSVQEFTVAPKAMATLQAHWLRQLRAHGVGTWAPLKMRLSDEDLALLGLPPAQVLQAQSFDRPTMIDTAGNTSPVDLAPLATFAGTGFVGIRPGAFLLIIEDTGISWCSLAHVVGSPGSYRISTAGHCGPVGQRATVIAAMGNHAGTLNPIVLDFGSFSASTNQGVGNDWALIDIAARFQSLVTPTMAFWGGPRGTYTKTGATATVRFPSSGGVPSITTNTEDPLLAQGIVHYGHGTGIGAGGTPRSGTSIHWGLDHFMFFGAVSPGDSGSGANTLGGDSVGATMEAAGIITHRWIDTKMSDGLGIMAGTRSTALHTPVARGQLLGYPAPIPLLP
jgi:hypothetical protein